MRDPRQSYYRVLMVAEHADQEIITTVHRKLAKRYHPDLEHSPEAAKRMAELNEAYHVLSDPQRRKRYDAELASRRDRRSTDRLVRRAGDLPYGAAGMPGGPAQGSVINIGRYSGWSLGQIRRHDPEFLEWLLTVPAGRQYRAEILSLLRRPSN
jgi:curved DNA-binding protein CbpA